MKMTQSELRKIIKADLFDIWLRSNLDDWTNHEMRDLHILYHSVFTEGEN